MDIVVVTLRRKTLPVALQSARQVIPEPHIILVTDKTDKTLTRGMLLNKGLAQAKSELVCFLDDDIILNHDWYNKCLAALQDPSVIAVAGRARNLGEAGLQDTMGCMIAKTAEFKLAGGFPKLDCYLRNRENSRFRVLQDAICEHYVSRGTDVIGHTLQWMFTDFQTETRVGLYHNPKWSVRQILKLLGEGKPDYAVAEVLWLVKTFCSLPFLVMK